MIEDSNINEHRVTYDGCYGSKVKADELVKFLSKNFEMNEICEKINTPRFAQCVWGHAGIGKSDIVKQFSNLHCTWNGKSYPGYNVVVVPIAQFEEMGDLHGIPYECFLMKNNNGDSSWVHKEAIPDYKNIGYFLCNDVSSRTKYAPPDWVPLKEGPCILILDDFNRASIRIIKGIMQLLQNYGMISWSLPAGCNIVLTGNPCEQDYLVTSIDSAILTRIKHITLVEDVDLWVEWATKQDLDSRGISWVLYEKEMICGKERTNPRTLTEFFRYLKTVGEFVDDEIRKEVIIHANSLLDEETVSSFITFCTCKMEDIVEPIDILNGNKESFNHIERLMNRKEPRIDILSVIVERLFATIVNNDVEQTKERIKNFQEFITMDFIPEDLTHMVCRRIIRRKDSTVRNQKWVLGNKKLSNLIISLLH